jgi:hypothetical protein
VVCGVWGVVWFVCTNAMGFDAPDVTVKAEPLLATPPTVTTTLPEVAPAGTGATILVALQLDGVGVANVPLKVIVLEP